MITGFVHSVTRWYDDFGSILAVVFERAGVIVSGIVVMRTQVVSDKL